MVSMYAMCTVDTCPVSRSIYGYAPSKAANIVFAAIFGISFIVYLVQSVRSRSWSFMVGMCVGTASECLGYVGRLMLSKDPFSANGFKIQIICLTFAPAFLSAGIYLILKHLVLIISPSLSRIRPAAYTWLFILFDIISILLQSIGATIAAVGSDVVLGNNVMIAGLSSQIITMFGFGVLSGEYAWRVYRNRRSGQLNADTVVLRASLRFRLFVGAAATAYFTVLIRCCYRLAEMAGGWRSPLMQSEIDFIILDSLMCSIMVIALNIFPPGFVFKISKQQAQKAKQSTELDSFSGLDANASPIVRDVDTVQQ